MLDLSLLILRDFGHPYILVCLGIYPVLEALIPFLEEIKLACSFSLIVAFLLFLLFEKDILLLQGG